MVHALLGEGEPVSLVSSFLSHTNTPSPCKHISSLQPTLPTFVSQKERLEMFFSIDEFYSNHNSWGNYLEIFRGLTGKQKILTVLKLNYVNVKVCPHLNTDFLSHLKVGTIERVQKGKLALRQTWKLPFHICSFKRTWSYYDIGMQKVAW